MFKQILIALVATAAVSGSPTATPKLVPSVRNYKLYILFVADDFYRPSSLEISQMQ